MAPRIKEKSETRAGCVSQGTGKRSWKMNTSERVAANMTMKVKSIVRSCERSPVSLEEEAGADCMLPVVDGDDVEGVVFVVDLLEAVEDANLSEGAGIRSRMDRLMTISIVWAFFSIAMS